MVDYKQQIMNWEKKMESSLMMFMRQLLCMLRRNNLQACIPKGRQCEKKGLAFCMGAVVGLMTTILK